MNSQCPTGDLEKTILRRFCIEQDLRAGFSKAMLPAALHSLVNLFSQKFKPSTQGTLVADAISFASGIDDGELAEEGSDDELVGKDKRIELPQSSSKALKKWLRKQSGEIHDITLPLLALQEKSLVYRGASYKPKHISTRDSHVAVGTTHSWRSAQIQSIFTFTYYISGKERMQTCLIIKRSTELEKEDARFDHYRTFATAGRICYSQEGPGEEVISPTELLCHVARTPGVCSRITKPHVHVLPLDRVCGSSMQNKQCR